MTKALRRVSTTGSLLALGFARVASAQTMPTDVADDPPDTASSWTFDGFAVGAAVGWQVRREFGNTSRTSLTPELLLQTYLTTPLPDLFLRFGLRVGYGAEQAESPAALTFSEHDITAMVVTSFLYEWYVVPALSIGVGPLVRVIDVSPGGEVDASPSRLNRTALLFAAFVQIGLGFPIENGIVVIEPFARYEIVPDDDRLSWRFGADLTVGF